MRGLLGEGADVNHAERGDGRSPLLLAIEQKKIEARARARWCLSCGPALQRHSHKSVLPRTSPQVARVLVGAGADIEQRSKPTPKSLLDTNESLLQRIGPHIRCGPHLSARCL